MSCDAKLTLWEKHGRRRVYINHPDYSDLKICVDDKTGPSIRADYPVDHQSKMMIAEKLEPSFIEAEALLAKGD